MGRPVVALLFLLCLAGCEQAGPLVANGEPAPGFTLIDLDGRTLSLADLHGQVVAIRFWADWCPFCEGEMAELEPVHETLAPRGLRILAINVAQEESVARRAAARYGISYTVLLDREGAVTRQYGVMALPVTFLVDRKGVVRAKVIGPARAEAFEQLVLELL